MNKSTKERLQRYSALIIFTFALLAAGGIFASVKFQLWPNYAVPILQGLLGSAAAGFLIDIAARRKFAKEIAQEIFPYVVGQFYPKEARDFINQFIHTEIILSNKVLRYVFKPLDGGRVKIEIRIDFEVKNYSVKPVSYTSKIQIKEKDLPEILGLACGYLTGEKGGIKTRPYTPVKDSDKRQGIAGFESKKTKLKPISGDFPHPYKVTWQFSIIKAMDDDDLISFGCPTIGVEIQAQYDPQKLKVEIDEDEYGIKRLDNFTWRSPADCALFVAGRHIQIKWRPTEGVRKFV